MLTDSHTKMARYRLTATKHTIYHGFGGTTRLKLVRWVRNSIDLSVKTQFRVGVWGMWGHDSRGSSVPSGDTFRQWYCAASDLQIRDSQWQFYKAFQCFRKVAIFHGVFVRWLGGNAATTEAKSYFPRFAGSASQVIDVIRGDTATSKLWQRPCACASCVCRGASPSWPSWHVWATCVRTHAARLDLKCARPASSSLVFVRLGSLSCRRWNRSTWPVLGLFEVSPCYCEVLAKLVVRQEGGEQTVRSTLSSRVNDVWWLRVHVWLRPCAASARLDLCTW